MTELDYSDKRKLKKNFFMKMLHLINYCSKLVIFSLEPKSTIYIYIYQNDKIKH